MDKRVSKAGGSHRIGLYVRVSTEEQAENPEGSIKSQEQRLRQQIQFRNAEGIFGEVADVFIDRAKSGKDTNRPELQRLLQAVRRREVTIVMVTELSRLSRSIKDFCEIWELMRANGCEFQSLREQFDTTTAAGEMVLYTIANIAQFERRQVSERVIANVQARSQRGLYNGGIVPVGYRLIPDKKGYLAVDEEQAPVIRQAFAAFIEQGTLARAARWLNDHGQRLTRRTEGGGYRPRLGHFTVDTLHTILRNPTYAGIKAYRLKGEAREASAVWPALVEGAVFQRVQEILTQNHCRKKPSTPKRYPYLLSGIAFCGSCGDRLPGKSAHGNGGKIAYYDHGWAAKRQACLAEKVFACSPTRVLAKKLEPEVWRKVEELLTRPETAEALLADALKVPEVDGRGPEITRLKEKSRAIQGQLEALAERLAQLPKTVSAAPVFRQMEKLEQAKAEHQARLSLLERETAYDRPAALADYQRFTAALRSLAHDKDAAETRAQIVQRVLTKVEILPEGYRLYFAVGQGHVDWELARTAGSLKENPAFSGSNSLQNGWASRGRTRDRERERAP